MRIKLHSHYEHFPNHKPLDGLPYLHCYNDDLCYREEIEPNSIALLVEPRSIQPRTYEWMEQNYKRFRYVFTHDSKLLNICDNAKLILWGGGCGGLSEFKHIGKSKNISMVSSDKTMCELHNARIELTRMLRNNPYVDVMGTVDGGEYVTPDEIYQEYKYSIAFENYIDDYWFTEKICNCFENLVVPIYYGARKIDEFFNPAGIIRVSDWREIPVVFSSKNDMIIKQIMDAYYTDEVQEAIEDNYIRVQKYKTFEYWFFNEYGELLNDLHS